ncbi:MAG: hypothetical protein QXH61_08415 [Candidatus Nezhaarchaeales archaeon]
MKLKGLTSKLNRVKRGNCNGKLYVTSNYQSILFYCYCGSLITSEE